jgi:hypothetical protein
MSNYDNRPFKKPRKNKKTGDLLNLKYASQLGIENKFVDDSIGAYTLSDNISTSLIDPVPANCLFGIGQGDEPNQRDGRKCTLTSIHIRAWFISEGTNDTVVRFMLVQDKQTNGAQLDPNFVLQPTTTSSIDALAFRNLEYSSRFNVICDKEIRLTNTITGTSGPLVHANAPQAIIHFDKKVNIPVSYSTSAATVGDIVDNSFHVMCFRTAAPDTDVVLRYNCRARFVG